MNTTKFAFSVALGAAYWLLAALFVRAFGSYFFTGNTRAAGAVRRVGARHVAPDPKRQVARPVGAGRSARRGSRHDLDCRRARRVAITFFGWVYGTSAPVVMLGGRLDSVGRRLGIGRSVLDEAQRGEAQQQCPGGNGAGRRESKRCLTSANAR
jgi:hypothetical protein